MLPHNKIISNILGISPVQRQSLIALFWQIAFTLIGFLSTIYFAHTVGAAVLGAYFLFVAYNGIFNMITDGGFGGAAIKRISEGEEEDAYFSTFFVLRFVFTMAVIIFLLFFRNYFVDLDTSGMFFWLILALIVSLLEGSISTGVAGAGKMGIRLTCAGIGNISRVLFQVLAVYLGYGAAGLAGGFVGAMLMTVLVEFRFFDLHFKRFKWSHFKSLSVFSLWLFLTSGGALVFSQADTVMIGYFMGNADVGVYRVLIQFTTIATFTTYALRNTLWPKVSRWSKSGDLGLVKESLSRSISYSLILAIPVFVGGTLLGDKLLFFFYGSEFANGYWVLIILLAVQIVNIFQYFFTMYLDAMDYPHISFRVTAIGVGANIMLNFLLIPLIGIMGAAIATLVTMVLNGLLAGHALSRLIYIKLEYQSLMNILIASVVMGMFVVSYRLVIPLSNLWITFPVVVIGGMVYGVLVLKLDRNICCELHEIVQKMGMERIWPRWL